MRIFFMDRKMTLQEAIELRAQQGRPHLSLPIENHPLPQDGKLTIPVTEVKFHPIDESGREIPPNEKQIRTFEIAEQVGNSETGDIDIFAYALPDD